MNTRFAELHSPVIAWTKLDALYVEYLHLKGYSSGLIAKRVDRSANAVECLIATFQERPDWNVG